ncbi:hypothetical protein GF359_03135 [candidate division WOR-3 bacterium]|uniref:Uncharacterized protein n=1 Tax=candidate division WOR-3 bacterium TaxID=2052148 RepID=A0A9D5K9P6_UNCW3|nr:hypothetical protein [candidate division WOR-3 bacterium]MBD3364189.1 hypothetical protein [candidate division WOR-3 bacterium]
MISRDQARALVAELGQEEKDKSNSEGVATRAESICKILKDAGQKVDTEKVVVSALLKNVGRGHRKGLDIGASSAEMLTDRGHTDVAEIVRVYALPQTANVPLEAKILIYADMTTGPDGESIDPMKKLTFLQRLGNEWKDEKERVLAREAFEVKRRIVSEIDTLIKQSIAEK